MAGMALGFLPLAQECHYQKPPRSLTWLGNWDVPNPLKWSPRESATSSVIFFCGPWERLAGRRPLKYIAFLWGPGTSWPASYAAAARPPDSWGLNQMRLFPPHPEVTRTAVPEGSVPTQEWQRDEERRRATPHGWLRPPWSSAFSRHLLKSLGRWFFELLVGSQTAVFLPPLRSDFKQVVSIVPFVSQLCINLFFLCLHWAGDTKDWGIVLSWRRF